MEELKNNCPLTKEQFRNFLDYIKEQAKKQVKINKVFTETFEDSVFYPYLGYEAKMIELLEIIMRDTNNDISYFMYETNFGGDADKYFITLEDGVTKIKFYTPDDLYDYLINEHFKEEVKYES